MARHLLYSDIWMIVENPDQASHASSAHLLQLEPAIAECSPQELQTMRPASEASIRMAQGRFYSHPPWPPAKGYWWLAPVCVVLRYRPQLLMESTCSNPHHFDGWRDLWPQRSLLELSEEWPEASDHPRYLQKNLPQMAFGPRPEANAVSLEATAPHCKVSAVAVPRRFFVTLQPIQLQLLPSEHRGQPPELQHQLQNPVPSKWAAKDEAIDHCPPTTLDRQLTRPQSMPQG